MKVKCISAECSDLTLGLVYEVQELIQDNGYDFYKLSLLGKPVIGEWDATRFEEVLAAPVTGLPEDPKARKALPICTGVLDYFPDALAAVAEVSRIGNEQHNPGEPLHWARGKSNDQEDALVRHLVDRGKKDTDGARHSAKVAWRALALLQLEIEKERGGK